MIDSNYGEFKISFIHPFSKSDKFFKKISYKNYYIKCLTI